MPIARVSSGHAFQNDVDASLTLSHTVAAGDNRLMVALIDVDSGLPIVSVKYATVSMTQDAYKDRVTPNGSPVAIYHLVAPAVGTADAEFIKTGSTGGMALAVGNYTGCKQTGQPDATATANGESASSASYNITTVADDCWIMTAEYDNIGSMIDGTNCIKYASPSNGHYLCDSNASVGAAGSKTIAFSWAGSGPYRSASASYAPAPAAVASTGFFFGR